MLKNEVRLIGGQWKRSKLPVTDRPGLRPTPDRVRETLFNWLQPHVAGSRCLDLFAGSGALGIEALSRGAAQVVFVDRETRVAAQLRNSLAMLGAMNAEVAQAEALQFLRTTAHTFDIVFLDPPFASGLRAEACRALAQQQRLAPGALVYIEQPARSKLEDLPTGWEILRTKRAGEVGYHLLRSPT
ncbi:MAG: 16S rRNA (guanine(966)-N(2))-methyltransferase RsmD [Gammaproteobacteria bacterium]|nr:16S rRNA (guanine(966)-N(2))-methyltransferase RsmD [Gammaproteobacteria bacterium]